MTLPPTMPPEESEGDKGISFEKPKEKGPPAGGHGEWIVQSSMAASAAGKGASTLPVAYQSHLNLGVLYCEQEQYDEAKAELEKAIALDGKMLEAHLYLGNSYAGQGNIDKAIECYQTCLKLDPDSVDTLLRIGEAYLKRGDHEA